MKACVTYHLLQTRASGVYVCPFPSMNHLFQNYIVVCEFINLNGFFFFRKETVY